MDGPSGRAGSRCVPVPDQWLWAWTCQAARIEWLTATAPDARTTSGPRAESRPAGRTARTQARAGARAGAFRLYCKACAHYRPWAVRAANSRGGQRV